MPTRVKKPIGYFEIGMRPHTFFFQSRSVFGFDKMSGEEDVILVAVAALIINICIHVLKKMVTNLFSISSLSVSKEMLTSIKASS